MTERVTRIQMALVFSTDADQIRKNRRMVQDSLDEVEAELKALRGLLTAVQTMCEHDYYTNSPPPYDSHMSSTCLICGYKR